jgi:CubicO group peptidase (beta-lactamase class C family)
MLHRICRITILVALFAAVIPIAASDEIDLEKAKTALAGMIERTMDERGIPSVSIALVKDDEIVWTEAFGYANVRTRTAATPDTIYSTGSTFKSVTATALMQLVEQGKCKLDDPVNQYLGDHRVQDRIQSEKQVTIRHILSHWSGLLSGTEIKPIWGRELPMTLEEISSKLYSIRAPEVKWEYNNYAYAMAGLLVEKISGMDYETYVVENILKPLGVETPNPVAPSPEMVELMALPYWPGGADGEPTPVAQYHYDVYPAGDIFLTAEDMARFLGAHLNGGMWGGNRILSEESVREMHTAQFGGYYSLGFAVKKAENGHTLISHSGSVRGQNSVMMGDVDARVGVYIMSNSGVSSSIGEAAIHLLRGEEYTLPQDREYIDVDPEILATYAGKYDLAGRTILEIAVENNGLFVIMPGMGKFELPAETASRFWLIQEGWIFNFVAGDDGSIDRIDFESDGITMYAERLEE